MKYDLVVVGGGPAGMMAAGRAGELGARVFLIEKNDNLGRKLLICGKGRCNITNSLSDLRELVERYGDNGKFLFSALNNFGTEQVVSFFEDRGVETKIERGQRVFPVSDKSVDVLEVMIEYLKESKVEIKFGYGVRRIVRKKNLIEKVILDNGEEIFGEKFLIATGGKSYPITGSTGDAYEWLKKIGHKINKLRPSLTPVVIKEKFINDLAGLSLKNVEISIYTKKKKIDSRFGEALFTHNGMSGPIIIDMSKKIGEYLPGEVSLEIDFKPALDFKKLDERLMRDFKENQNKKIKNIIGKLVPQKLIQVMLNLSKIDPEKQVNLITKEERRILLHLLKQFKLSIKSLVGYEKAIVTSGGVDLREVNPKTCQSKIIDNLYLAGEILDLDGPTGGYNLQICWSTGYAVGSSCTTE